MLLVVLCIACVLAWWHASTRPTLTTRSSQIKHPVLGQVTAFQIVGEKLGWSLEHRHQKGEWVSLLRVEPSRYSETSLWVFQTPTATPNQDSVEIWHDRQQLFAGLLDRTQPAGYMRGNHTIKSIGQRFFEIHWVDEQGHEQKHEFRVTR